MGYRIHNMHMAVWAVSGVLRSSSTLQGQSRLSTITSNLQWFAPRKSLHELIAHRVCDTLHVNRMALGVRRGVNEQWTFRGKTSRLISPPLPWKN